MSGEGASDPDRRQALNVAPELSIDAPSTAEVGEPFVVTGSAVDHGDDVITYQIDCGAGFGPLQTSTEFCFPNAWFVLRQRLLLHHH